ncbi:MAG TPA: ATP-binding protein [Stellaceae bacterium]|jgi:signal transduction histidine kinase|nr:ATP-binding protein [Stellaceae bacterium]
MFELFRSSTFRLIALYTGLFAVSVAALLAFIYWQTVVYAERQTGETLDAELTGLSEQYRRAGLSGLVEVINERSAPARGSTMLYLLVDKDGQPLAGNLTRWPNGQIDPEGWLRFTLRAPPVNGQAAQDHVVQAESFLLPGGYQLLVGRDLAEDRQFRDRITDTLAWSAAVTLCLALIGGILMSRSVLSRLESINRTSSRIMAGEFSRRIPLKGSDDEFDRLAANLNRMLDRIQALMTGMRQVTDNIAHDLRSPLGRLRSRIEVALLDPPSIERYRAHLEETIEDADRLLATFSALLGIAEAEAHSARGDMVAVDMTEIARGIADLYEPVAEETGLGFASELAPGPLPVLANRHLLSQALANVVENALKYTEPGGTVRLSLMAEPADHVTVLVADTGPGIPAWARAQVFDRFYRLEASRTTPGNGLGLSLVRAVIGLHEGVVALEDTVPGAAQPGLTVRITLPHHAESAAGTAPSLLHKVQD